MFLKKIFILFHYFLFIFILPGNFIFADVDKNALISAVYPEFNFKTGFSGQTDKNGTKYYIFFCKVKKLERINDSYILSAVLSPFPGEELESASVYRKKYWWKVESRSKIPVEIAVITKQDNQLKTRVKKKFLLTDKQFFAKSNQSENSWFTLDEHEYRINDNINCFGIDIEFLKYTRDGYHLVKNRYLFSYTSETINFIAVLPMIIINDYEGETFVERYTLIETGRLNNNYYDLALLPRDEDDNNDNLIYYTWNPDILKYICTEH